MKAQFQPWRLLLLILADWINRSQQNAIEYLLTENRVLRKRLGKKRILLSDEQRRRLAVKGKILGWCCRKARKAWVHRTRTTNARERCDAKRNHFPGGTRRLSSSNQF